MDKEINPEICSKFVKSLSSGSRISREMSKLEDRAFILMPCEEYGIDSRNYSFPRRNEKINQALLDILHDKKLLASISAYGSEVDFAHFKMPIPDGGSNPQNFLSWNPNNGFYMDKSKKFRVNDFVTYEGYSHLTLTSNGDLEVSMQTTRCFDDLISPNFAKIHSSEDKIKYKTFQVSCNKGLFIGFILNHFEEKVLYPVSDFMGKRVFITYRGNGKFDCHDEAIPYKYKGKYVHFQEWNIDGSPDPVKYIFSSLEKSLNTIAKQNRLKPRKRKA